MLHVYKLLKLLNANSFHSVVALLIRTQHDQNRSYLIRALISACDGHKVHDGHRHCLAEQRDDELASVVFTRTVSVFDRHLEPRLISDRVFTGVNQRHRACQYRHQHRNHLSTQCTVKHPVTVT